MPACYASFDVKENILRTKIELIQTSNTAFSAALAYPNPQAQ